MPTRRRIVGPPISVFPTADRAAAAALAHWVDLEVAHLAGAGGRADEWIAIDDQPAVNADLAGHVDEVTHADAGPQVCSANAPRSASLAIFTGRLDPSQPGHELSERHISPAQVRGEVHEAVGAADDACDRDAEAGYPAVGGDRRPRRLDELADIFNRLVDGETPGSMGHASAMQDAAAENDHRR
ncbi:MAG TPA: hypothetical protein VMU65_04865 [Candidatus Saccharimonadales bacterium]|nr:hypothetical protein [Candidatus Saccharimonadales bacterium]